MESKARKADAAPPKKVLVVDDEPDIVGYLVALLEDNGYRTSQARSAEEAFRLIEQAPPDLVCMDIMMPGKSGILLYQRMRRDRRFEKIPAVIISAFCMSRDFFGAGFRRLITDPAVPEPEAYLEKPVREERLLEVISGILEAGDSPA